MSCSNNSIIWIIIVLLFCGCNGNNNGIGNFFGCGNDCNWIIILVILLCCCGNNNFGICEPKC
ncbi:MAG: chorion class high-cysteine HCB protein 13 [Anaerotignaceae bacterium]|nr:chorion class high-cysteine HCB protein 13 [Eubacterium sp.]